MSGRFLGRPLRNHWFLHRILAIPPQNRALALVLGTFPTSDSSESCSRLSPGHISYIRLSRSQRNHWFLHRILTIPPTIPPQNRALASVLATFPTSDSSESCSRHSPGHISHIRLSRSQRNHWFLHRILAIPPRALLRPHHPTLESCARLSPWLHFRHQTHQNHALALVLATFRTSDSSESCSRLSPGYISDIRLIRIMLSP